jgi:hypothetical protein
LRPKAINADFKRSSPRDANSSQDENAEISNAAPAFAKALPVVSFYKFASVS